MPEAHPAVQERLKAPIPLPGSVMDDREQAKHRLAVLERKSLMLRDLANLYGLPQWQVVQARCQGVIEKILDALPEIFGPERDQLLGELKAWRAFAKAPQEAVEQLRRLDTQVDILRAATK